MIPLHKDRAHSSVDSNGNLHLLVCLCKDDLDGVLKNIELAKPFRKPQTTHTSVNIEYRGRNEML